MELTGNPAPTGTLATALAHAGNLLEARPDLAEQQSREILKAVPGLVQAEVLLASARRRQGDAFGARAILEPLVRAHPELAAAHFELGMAFANAGDSRAAIAALARAAAIEPRNAAAWRTLGDQYALVGDGAAADNAYAQNIRAAVNDPRLVEAATALCENNLPVAEDLLRKFLKQHPTDVAAIRMLAEVASRLGLYEDAEKLLARALELAPSFTAARHNYAMVLNRASKPQEALRQIDLLLQGDPQNPSYRALQAALLGQIGEYARACETYSSLLDEYPMQPKGWMSYAHSLKTLGRQPESIAAYRKAIAQLPSLGEVYWSLANLKTLRFTADEVREMETQLARSDIATEDRFHFEFALGKALEDASEFAESFAHYERGNRLRREALPYDAEQTASFVERIKAVFAPDFLSARIGTGSPAPDPIFIVGLPRAGSTLIEQILSSHSTVEGTMELQDMAQLAHRLGPWTKSADPPDYPTVLETLPHEKFHELGETYIRRTRVRRKSDKPLFIDKMPNNFIHTGLIHLILPNAKIIDARRHPLGCCFSNFKQHFARGQAFTYGLEDVGRHYRDYVGLMAHFDRVLPGRVHRVFYEDMVADPEREVRRLLVYCGLGFEDGCLRFYENDRAVRTASSEQVRQPIFTEAVQHWRNYEPWLGPLKNVLGPVLETYPAVPIL